MARVQTSGKMPRAPGDKAALKAWVRIMNVARRGSVLGIEVGADGKREAIIICHDEQGAEREEILERCGFKRGDTPPSKGEADQAYERVMAEATRYALIVTTYAGVALLATPAHQRTDPEARTMALEAVQMRETKAVSP